MMACDKLVTYHREILVLSDNGTTAIEWAWKMGEETTRPLLVIFLGTCSSIVEIYVQNTCKEAWAAGYQPVVVSHRGFDDRVLDVPRLAGFADYHILEDVVS